MFPKFKVDEQVALVGVEVTATRIVDRRWGLFGWKYVVVYNGHPMLLKTDGLVAYRLVK